MKRNYFRLILCLSLLTWSVGQTLAQNIITQDTLFNEPYVDIDEWRDQPVRHRYVHGGFKGTNTRFSFYFPPKEQYQGRFIQYITPFPDSENLSQGASGEEDKIGFSLSSGAYFIETNGGGRVDFGRPGFGTDPTIGAYRANAASAQYSRVVAAQIYGEHRPYGYAFGGSGGAYRTVGGMENTQGVWDGAVPYVIGSPMAIPNVFTVRMHTMRVLKDKLPQIIDALEPGGSGDMYAGLNTEEKEALQEVTKMGFPLQSWFGYKTMGIHGFLVLYQGVVMADRKYFTDDFWKVPGYLGANPPASLLKARIQQVSKIKTGIPVDQAASMGLTEPMSVQERGTADLAWKSMGGGEEGMPVAFQLEDVLPDVDFLGGDLIIKSGAAAGKTLQLTKIAGDKVVLGPTDPAVLTQIKPGDEVQVDNSNFLAVQTYHRHQVPGKEYQVWDQFRDADGKPVYPQRPMLLGPLFTRAASGVVPTGKFKGKMIVLSSLAFSHIALGIVSAMCLSFPAVSQDKKAGPGTDLYKSFQNPSDNATPSRVWWHWMNGNITKDGIRKDLLWMHRAGIGCFQNFDAAFMTPKLVAKPLAYMTPEWKDASRYATKLADSLKLEMAIAGSPGWSESGGP